MEAPDQPLKRAQVAGDILGVEHTADHVQRLWIALLHVGQKPGERFACCRVMAAIKPDLGPRRSDFEQGTSL